ncbi:hypothetical protein ACVXZ4_04060 [Lacisediminihabitans sp. FW035]
MAKLDTSRILTYKEAKELTKFADGKFSDPKVVERLIAAGANYEVPFPKHRTYPISSLIAAGLLTETGVSTKRGYTTSSGGEYVTARVSRLTVPEAQRESYALTRELDGLRSRITEVDAAEASVAAEIEAAKAQVAELRESNAQNARLAKSLRTLLRNHEARIAALNAHVTDRKDAEIAEAEAKIADLARQSAEVKALVKVLREPKPKV